METIDTEPLPDDLARPRRVLDWPVIAGLVVGAAFLLLDVWLVVTAAGLSWS